MVPFDDPAAFAAGILHFLDDPAALVAAAAQTRRVGADLAWPAVGVQIMEVLEQALHLGRPADSALPGLVGSSPPVRPDHLLTLVDDVGIVQHADGVLPSRLSGYCVDDVARLVIVAVGLERGDGTFGRMVSVRVSRSASPGWKVRSSLHAVSENEGAESTLAYFQALLALEAVGLQGSLPEP